MSDHGSLSWFLIHIHASGRREVRVFRSRRDAHVRRDDGRTIFEFLALGILAVIVVVALATSGVGTTIGHGVSTTVCRVVSGDRARTCTTAPKPQAAPVARATPIRGGHAPAGSTDKARRPLKVMVGHPDECHGFFGCALHYGKNLAEGASDGAVAFGGGLAHIARHPVSTVTNWAKYQWNYGLMAWPHTYAACGADPRGYECMSHAMSLANPLTTLVGGPPVSKEAYTSAQDGDYATAVGRAGTDVGSMFVPIPGAKALGRAARAAKVARAARAGEDAGAAGAEAAKPDKVPDEKVKNAPKNTAGADKWPGPETWRKGATYYKDPAAFQKWLDEKMGPQTSKLGKRQREALFNYRLDPNYRDINDYLRGERPATPEAKRDVPLIDGAMKRSSLPSDVIAARVVGDDAFKVPVSRLPGRTITDPGYLSVSAAPKPEERPAVWQNIFRRKATPVNMYLRVPKGTHAVAPGYLGDGGVFHPGQKDLEITLDRGTKYRVDHVEKVDGIWNVYGTVIK
ncbi:MAG TPA: ADP-ribosyltransferase [Streptosporangiaceae bacterium]|jgi:hypothetical protein